MVQADDVLATVCGNQANVMMLQHRYEQALALAERSVSLHEAHGSGHGLAVALATLGQICVRLGDLGRAEDALHRALDVRSPIQFHETTGAVFDTLAQIHLIRGRYDTASDFLGRASEAYGAYGRQTSQWYEWSVRVLGARLALRRAALDEAVARVDEILQAGAPPFDALQATLIAAEALIAGEPPARGRAAPRRRRRRARPAGSRRPRGASISACAARCTPRPAARADAYHDFSQSAALLDLLGERYQSGAQPSRARPPRRRNRRALGRRAPSEQGARHLPAARRRARPRRHPRRAVAADHDRHRPVRHLAGRCRRCDRAADRGCGGAARSARPRNRGGAARSGRRATARVVYVELAGGDVRVVATAGCETDAGAGDGAIGRQRQRLRPRHHRRRAARAAIADGPRFGLVASPRPIGHPVMRRLRMIARGRAAGVRAVRRARSSGARRRPRRRSASLEPLLPGFLSASAAMARVVEQIQRLQGNDLTVLITGESGTGKELVSRAIHVGSHRSAGTFLPYNCTTTGRDLADSQLFGHRRGSFTGAVTDQPGLIRTAAGGTLFLDEIGDLPLDVQPKLLRFLEQHEIMPIGETKPQRVDVRVLAATNADLEQRVAEGKFREDLYYRLSVIRIHVPPLRERREEIPHLSTFFLREATRAARQARRPSELGNARRVLAVLVAGQRAPAEERDPARGRAQRARRHDRTGPPVAGDRHDAAAGAVAARSRPSRATPNLAAAVEQVERDLIQAALDRAAGNISETARALGLTRRGLYLKIRRLGLDCTGRNRRALDGY